MSIVGNFDENGLNVNNWNGNRNDNVGCGAARQSFLYSIHARVKRAFALSLSARPEPAAEHATNFIDI